MRHADARQHPRVEMNELYLPKERKLRFYATTRFIVGQSEDGIHDTNEDNSTVHAAS